MAETADAVDMLVSLVATVDVCSTSAEQYSKLVLATEKLVNAVNALAVVVMGEFDRCGVWADDGAMSAAGWLAARTGTPVRVLRARVRTGAGLRLLPAAVPAARAGRLSPQHVAALAGCARRHPDLAARDETVLVEAAHALDADAFTAAARQWVECAAAVDGPDPSSEPTPEPVDKVHLSRTFEGRYQLNGSLSAESGELLHAALEAHVDRQLRVARDGDPSVAPVASQVRAAALVDLAAQCMRREPSDQSVPDRYRVAVVVHADDTRHLPKAACDSPAFRVVLGAPSEVLDVGRLTPAWPAGIRRAITLRDDGCVFPGCDRPPSWCDIHHCQPWEHGGHTCVGNGALVCRRHHTFIHRHHWTVAVEDGKPVVRKPDGDPYVISRWNAAA